MGRAGGSRLVQLFVVRLPKRELGASTTVLCTSGRRTQERRRLVDHVGSVKPHPMAGALDHL